VINAATGEPISIHSVRRLLHGIAELIPAEGSGTPTRNCKTVALQPFHEAAELIPITPDDAKN